jgi:ELWxxDGT repeat protein
VTDGAAAGTHEIVGIANASDSGFGLEPTDLTVFDNLVLFQGVDAARDRGLWITDGATAGTHQLTNNVGAAAGVNPDQTRAFNPTDMVVFDGKVYFAGEDASGRIGLWMTDGTSAGTSELTGIAGASTGIDVTNGAGADPAGLNPSNIIVYNSELLFSGWDANGLAGLWVSDGTAVGTHERTGIPGASTTVAESNPSSIAHADLEPTSLVVAGGLVFFARTDSRADTAQPVSGFQSLSPVRVMTS